MYGSVTIREGSGKPRRASTWLPVSERAAARFSSWTWTVRGRRPSPSGSTTTTYRYVNKSVKTDSATTMHSLAVLHSLAVSVFSEIRRQRQKTVATFSLGTGLRIFVSLRPELTEGAEVVRLGIRRKLPSLNRYLAVLHGPGDLCRIARLSGGRHFPLSIKSSCSFRNVLHFR